MKTPNQILKDARVAKGLTQTQMAASIDIGLRMYQKIEEGQFPKYKREQIREIEKVLDISIYEQIYEQDNNLEIGEEKTYLQKRLEQKNNNEKKVDVYGGFTTLGNITLYDDDSMKHEVIAQLPAELFPNCDYAEKAKGDSMYPLIMNQALLVGKVTTAKGITFGEKYIIKTFNGMDTTKYVHPSSEVGKIKLIAYNKHIPEQEIDIKEIIFVCRVHWIINPT